MFRKKVVSMSLAIGICLTSLTSFAENSAESKSKLGKMDKELVTMDKKAIISAIESLEEKEFTNPKILDSQNSKVLNSEVSTYGMAKPLSTLEVIAVGSTHHKNNTGNFYEDISSLQFSTRQDHGGEEFIVVTYELGHGTSQKAQFNQRNATLLGYDFVDINGDYIIDGYINYWGINGLSSSDYGEFTYEARSINYPYNFMYDSINIR